MNFIIKRISMTDKWTLGVIMYDTGLIQIPFGVTMENPWINNEQDISCIPHGRYRCKPVNSPKFRQTYEVMDVPDRSHILFHKGNIVDDTAGCILVGEKFEPIGAKQAIQESRKGFLEFMTLAAVHKDFWLDIHECCSKP